MTRRIAGLLAACVAAPYLMAFFTLAFEFFSDGGPVVETPLDLFKAIPIGTLALILLGLPLLCAASLLAVVLYGNGWERRWHVVLAACLLGLCFAGFTFSWELKKSFALLFQGGLAGAFCGWIYWRIAIKQTPEKGHAIDAA